MHAKWKKDPKELSSSGQGRTKLAGRGGGKGERPSACQLPHCAPVFALPGSGRGAGWDEGLWRGSIVALGRSTERKNPLNCVGNSPCILSDSVFIAWLVTASLLLVVVRRWGAVTPLSFPAVFALQRWMGCCYLPSSILHSQKLSAGTAGLLGSVPWHPSAAAAATQRSCRDIIFSPQKRNTNHPASFILH